MKSFFLFTVLIICASGINPVYKNPVIKTKTVIVQPFAGINSGTVAYVYKKIKPIFEKVELRPPMSPPTSAFYKPRNRYRADSMIAFLKRRTEINSTTIGLIASDISTTSRGYVDWGIMGLAYTPGSSCIASTYRLSKSATREEFYKVCIHELGHTAGLPHCKIKTCFMRDANGQNPVSEEKDFCPSCKSHLLKAGWKL